MAIVNRTPDSFYDQGATWDDQPAFDRVRQVVEQGAEIVDQTSTDLQPDEERLISYAVDLGTEVDAKPSSDNGRIRGLGRSRRTAVLISDF